LLGVWRCISRLRALSRECHNIRAQEDDDDLILRFVFSFRVAIRDGSCRDGLFRSPVVFLLFLFPRLLTAPALPCYFWQLSQILRGFSVA